MHSWLKDLRVHFFAQNNDTKIKLEAQLAFQNTFIEIKKKTMEN